MDSSKLFRGIGNSLTLLAVIKVFTLSYTLYTQMSFYSSFTNTKKKLFMYSETNDNVVWIEIVLLHPIFYGKADRLFIFVTSQGLKSQQIIFNQDQSLGSAS